MKKFCILVVLATAGICSLAAQDMIVLKDGNMIEGKVLEISPTEIRYKRAGNLDGPTIVIPAANVLSIRYENGDYEVINAGPAAKSAAAVRQPRARNTEAGTTAMNPDKFIFGINANAGGAVGYLWGGGAGISMELGKGKFNSEINLMFPRGGFGGLVTFNYFWPSRIGGAYAGGGLGGGKSWWGDSFTIGANGGYKFVTKSGVYFRTGAFVGYDFLGWLYVYFKPDLAVGWTMR